MGPVTKLGLLLFAALVWGGVVKAQTELSSFPGLPSESQIFAPTQPYAVDSLLLPDMQIEEASAATDTPTWSPPVSSSSPGSGPFLHRVVKPGLGPQDLTASEKFEMAFRSRLSFGAVGSSLFGAGERQLFNSRPHYGTDSGAFGERLGAAELKQVSESFFSYGVYASLFHSDPHYYVMGPGHPLLHRAVYSASRVVITRTDSGGTNVNWAKLTGMASATALTNTYYPVRDRGVSQSLSAYGSSLASSVLTLELHEFVPDLFAMFKHKNKRSL